MTSQLKIGQIAPVPQIVQTPNKPGNITTYYVAMYTTNAHGNNIPYSKTQLFF